MNQMLLMYSPYHEVLGDCPYVKLVPYSQNKAYVPVAEDLAARVLTLPTYYGLPLEDARAIAKNVRAIAACC